MSSVAVGRLRSIAKTVRQLPTFYQGQGSIADHYFLIVDKGAAFIREAESLGAFQGDSIYGRIGEKLAHPSCHLDQMVPIAAWTMPAWKLTVWYAVVDTLAPELIGIRSRSIVSDANGKRSMRFDTSEYEAEIVARAIEEEADRLEAQIKADKGPAEQGEDATTGVKFRWTPPMLEGYVFALLKEVEYPTEREAAEWIATKSRKREPARTTMRKTYAWQNRPQKTPKPRTTNEAQSGVSPAQNADPAMSHEEVTNAVLDIEEKLHRQLVDNERDAVVWTLQQAGADEEDRDEAVRQLIQGFRSGDM